MRYISGIADRKVVIKIENETAKIVHAIGVQQGDNMSQIRLLFLISPSAETLERTREEKGTPKAIYFNAHQLMELSRIEIV